MSLDLTIVVPVKNEAENIIALLDEVRDALANENIRYEVLFVDDGSTDETLPALRKAAGSYPDMRYLSFSENRGQTAAFSAGIDHAKGRLICTMDGDLQNDPRDIPRMIEHISDTCDMVCGIRRKREDNLVRKVSSRIANNFRNWLTDDDIIDVGCSLRVFTKACMNNVKLWDGMHRFFPTLVKMEGFKIKQIPVNHRPRERGMTKYGIRNRLFKGLRDVFAVRWMKSRHIQYVIQEESPQPQPANREAE